MATAARSLPKEKVESSDTSKNALLFSVFDLVEDQLEKMSPGTRKKWLDDLSETAEKIRARSGPGE